MRDSAKHRKKNGNPARKRELFDPLPELCSPLTPGVQLANLNHSGGGRLVSAALTGGSRFCTERFSHAETARFLNGPGVRWLLYGHTDPYKPVLILESADESQAGAWRELLEVNC